MQDSSEPPEFNRMVSFSILAQAFRVCYRLVNLCRAVVIGFMQDFEYDIFLGATSDLPVIGGANMVRTFAHP